MTDHPFDEPALHEPLTEGGTWLLDLIAAVDHLDRGYRPGFTVWDALEEALRWSLDADDAAEATDTPDPLATTLNLFIDSGPPHTAAALQAAIRRWVTTMADRYNNGHHWPHPNYRRGFPSPITELHAIS